MIIISSDYLQLLSTPYPQRASLPTSDNRTTPVATTQAQQGKLPTDNSFKGCAVQITTKTGTVGAVLMLNHAWTANRHQGMTGNPFRQEKTMNTSINENSAALEKVHPSPSNFRHNGRGLGAAGNVRQCQTTPFQATPHLLLNRETPFQATPPLFKQWNTILSNTTSFVKQRNTISSNATSFVKRWNTILSNATSFVKQRNAISSKRRIFC